MFLGVYVANNPAAEVTGQKGEIDMLTNQFLSWNMLKTAQ